MAENKNIQDELERLRQEVKTLRADEKAEGTAAADKPEPTPEPGQPETSEALKAEIDGLSKAVEDLGENAEKLIAERPLVALLAAFAVGLLVGRLLAR
jgi:ElaB/YqjD/DUF883 family membrane-anchored ribosome-binding protein